MLHVECLGQGRDVVFVHGWGLHGGVWSDTAQRLTHAFRVTLPDLPGHGRSPMSPQPFTLDDLAEALLAAAPPQAMWVGWSLGALATLAVVQRRPEAVARLVLVGATPRFVQAPDWAHGTAPQVLPGMARDLEVDFERTLLRFVNLQLGNGDAERAGLRRLRTELSRHGWPSTAALRAGLNILQTADLRAALPQIDVPALVIHGGRDRLAMPAAGEYLARTLPQARLHSIADAGHAPFMSHVDLFTKTVENFLHG